MFQFLFGVSITINIVLITTLIIYLKIKAKINKHNKALRNSKLEIEDVEQFKDFMSDFDFTKLLGGVKDDN